MTFSKKIFYNYCRSYDQYSFNTDDNRALAQLIADIGDAQLAKQQEFIDIADIQLVKQQELINAQNKTNELLALLIVQKS